MRKEQTGRVTIGKEKFWMMIYADDMVLLAKREEDLKGMIKRLRKYIEKKPDFKPREVKGNGV